MKLQGITRPAMIANAMPLEQAAQLLLTHREQNRLHPIDFQRLQAALDKARDDQRDLLDDVG
jgi:hypothetical protein